MKKHFLPGSFTTDKTINPTGTIPVSTVNSCVCVIDETITIYRYFIEAVKIPDEQKNPA